MIEKMFTSEQAMAHLGYAITCGFSFEKFIFGKGLYGNRVSLMRDKSAHNLFGAESHFKTSSFHVVEGIKSLEIPQTIIITRRKLELFWTNRENMLDFLDNYKADFVLSGDMEKVADSWYSEVGKKLLVSPLTDFNRLNNFVIMNMLFLLPISTQLDIAEFRKTQIMTLLTQQIVSEDFARAQLALMPANQDELVEKKQKLLLQKRQSVA